MDTLSTMQMPLIPTWSNSRLDTFETCPQWALLKFHAKIPDPSPRTAADRGTRMHKEAEDFILRDGPLTPEIAYALPRLEVLRSAFKEAPATVEVENNWGLDTDWAPTGYYDPNVWGRIKLDVCHHTSDTSARIIDWKSGKKFGNEVKHMLQAQTYEISTFMRYTNLQTVETVFNYFDQKTETVRVAHRDRVLRALPALDKRARKLTTATSFPAKPNKHNCRFCPYKPSGTGHCAVGVD